MTRSTGQDSLKPLARLYEILADLAGQMNGSYYVEDCTGRVDWLHFGVYVFFKPGTDFDAPPANWWVSRMGTVGISEGTGNLLWARLHQHRGTVSRGERRGQPRGASFVATCEGR